MTFRAYVFVFIALIAGYAAGRHDRVHAEVAPAQISWVGFLKSLPPVRGEKVGPNAVRVVLMREPNGMVTMQLFDALEKHKQDERPKPLALAVVQETR